MLTSILRLRLQMSLGCWAHSNTREHFTPEKHRFTRGRNVGLLNPNLHWLLGGDPQLPGSSLLGCFLCFVLSWAQGMLPRWLNGNPPADAGASRDRGSTPGSGPWKRKWQPTPAFLPGESHAQRSLAGCNPWGSRVGHHWATEHKGQEEDQGLSCNTPVPPALSPSLCSAPRQGEWDGSCSCGTSRGLASWGLYWGSLGTRLTGLSTGCSFVLAEAGTFHRQTNVITSHSDTIMSFQDTYSDILVKSLHPSQLCRELALWHQTIRKVWAVFHI